MRSSTNPPFLSQPATSDPTYGVFPGSPGPKEGIGGIFGKTLKSSGTTYCAFLHNIIFLPQKRMLDNFSIIIKDNCYRLALYLHNIIELSRRSVIIVHIAHPSQPVYNSISLAQSMYPQQQPMAALQTTTNKIQTGSSVTALVQLSQTKSLNFDAHLGMF